MRWPKYWSFSFSIIPSKEIPGLDLLQNGLVGSPCSSRDSQKSSPTPQAKASVLRRSAFFTVQLSHPYMTTAKTITLARQTLGSKIFFENSCVASFPLLQASEDRNGSPKVGLEVYALSPGPGSGGHDADGEAFPWCSNPCSGLTLLFPRHLQRCWGAPLAELWSLVVGSGASFLGFVVPAGTSLSPSGQGCRW